MAKSLLVLGADTFQLGIIEFLKLKGFEVHVISNRTNDLGNTIASFSHNVDYSKINDVLNVFNLVQATQVFCSASDAALFYQIQIQENLGISFQSSDYINFFLEKTNYKFRLLTILEDHSPLLFKKDQLVDLINKKNWPINGVVAKTSKGSGSKNIIIFKKPAQFLEFASKKIEESYFFENFVDGEEIGGDFICSNGQLLFYKPTMKFVNSFCVPIAHLVLKENKNEKPALDFLKKFIQFFEIQDGIYNVDLIVKNNNAYLIDISPRIGGNCIPEVIEKSCGVNEYEWMFNFLMNGNLNFLKPKWNCQHGVYIFGSDKKGKLKKIVKDELPFQKHVVELYWKFRIGYEVEIFTEGSRHLGYVIFNANSDEELLKIYNEMEAFDWFLVD